MATGELDAGILPIRRPRTIAMSHTRVDDREADRSIDLAQLERTLRASIVLIKRSRQEILRSRRRKKDTAALERVEVQIRPRGLGGALLRPNACGAGARRLPREVLLGGGAHHTVRPTWKVGLAFN